MALQSSGQISLSNIATEFGGSAPHAMSEYYSGGSNVPSGTQNASGVTIPTSGQIALATNFYGSVAETIVGSVTVNSIGTRSIKSGCIHHGYSNGHSADGQGGNSMGSVTSKSGIATSIEHVYFRDDNDINSNGTGTRDRTRWGFVIARSGFSKVRFTNGNGGTYTISSIPTPTADNAYDFDHGSFFFTNFWSGQSSVLVEFIQ